MKQYLELCKHVLENGQVKKDRTGTGTISYFGEQFRCNLQEGFPLLTTKKVFYKGILGELLWIISGSTNIKPLVDQNIRIWNEWPYDAYTKCSEYKGETIEEFVQKIKETINLKKSNYLVIISFFSSMIIGFLFSLTFSDVGIINSLWVGLFSFLGASFLDSSFFTSSFLG